MVSEGREASAPNRQSASARSQRALFVAATGPPQTARLRAMLGQLNCSTLYTCALPYTSVASRYSYSSVRVTQSGDCRTLSLRKSSFKKCRGDAAESGRLAGARRGCTVHLAAHINHPDPHCCAYHRRATRTACVPREAWLIINQLAKIAASSVV